MSRADDRRGEEEWRAAAGNEPDTGSSGSRLLRYTLALAIIAALAVTGWWFAR